VARPVWSSVAARTPALACSTAASNLPSTTSSQAFAVAIDDCRKGEAGVGDALTQSTTRAASERRALFTHSSAISAAASTTSGSLVSNSAVSRSMSMSA
jgi:hypothetical protein